MKNSKPNQIKSIYRKQCIQVKTIFERAKSPRKVLCVALDYAKRKHVALLCDGTGDILKKSFPVENTLEGVEFLHKEIQSTARRRKISKNTIFIGGEDEPKYVTNFIRALAKKGYTVLRVNAGEAAKQRENMLASTDTLDLLGISKCLLNRRASPSSVEDGQKSIYRDLRELTRTRRSYVRHQTATANRIHVIADQLFPSFLSETKSVIKPFGKASIALMKGRFSCIQISKRKHASLENTLRKYKVIHVDEKAADLIELAKNTLPPDPERIESLQQSLHSLVNLYECLEDSALLLRQQAALLLAKTPYIMLTSIPGISFVLAAGLAGEIGDPANLPTISALSSYAGIVPAVMQTGGPDSPAIHLSTRSRCNHILKDWVVQGSQKISLMGPPELKAAHLKREANGQHSIYAGARTLLRITRALVINETPYLSPTAKIKGASREDIEDGALQMWEKLVTKWTIIPGWQGCLTDESKPMGCWRRVIKELHDINLPIPNTRPPKANKRAKSRGK